MTCPRGTRLLRFSLRTLSLVSFVLAVALAWLHRRARVVDKTVTRIEELQGTILASDNSIDWLPYPYCYAFERMTEVDFSIRGEELYPRLPGRVTDQDLEFLATLRHLESLNLDNTRVTDKGSKGFQHCFRAILRPQRRPLPFRVRLTLSRCAVRIGLAWAASDDRVLLLQ
jgi:hypothetical protein